ncbi:MAG: flavodoxin family protein [bacterium]
MKVVGFNGSPRKNGNTSILINYVFEELNKEGIETELFNIAQKPLRGCMACGKCKELKNGRCIIENDDLNFYLEKMIEADGIILGSPTYFSNMSAEMAALTQRAGVVARANNHLLQRKIGTSVVAERRAGATSVFSALNYFFLIAQMVVPGSSYWNMGIGMGEGDVEKDLEGVQIMRTLGQNMAWILKKVN